MHYLKLYCNLFEIIHIDLLLLFNIDIFLTFILNTHNFPVSSTYFKYFHIESRYN